LVGIGAQVAGLPAVDLAIREARTGVVVGLLVAPVAFGQALLWKAPLELAFTVSATMFAICIWSTTVGSLIPILAERFGVDPAVLSVPLITTLVDATGLIIYFTIAKAIRACNFQERCANVSGRGVLPMGRRCFVVQQSSLRRARSRFISGSYVNDAHTS